MIHVARALECVGIALGSNIGDRQQTLRQALRQIMDQQVLTDIRASSMYETEAVGEGAGGKFINAAVTGFARPRRGTCLTLACALNARWEEIARLRVKAGRAVLI